MEAQRHSPSDSGFRPMGVIGSTCAFVNLLSLSAEGFLTPEIRTELQQNMLEYTRALELKETKRASEKRRAMEDAIRERKRQERSPRLPDLVTTCRYSCFDILSAHNHF